MLCSAPHTTCGHKVKTSENPNKIITNSTSQLMEHNHIKLLTNQSHSANPQTSQTVSTHQQHTLTLPTS